MKQSLQLRLGQHLTMTPQLQQAIRLLQLSTMELQLEVQEALESNLMLEVDEDGNSTASTESAVEGGEPEQDVVPGDIPSELPVDSAWEDIYDGVPVHHGSPEFNGVDYENPRAEAETLNNHLLWQLGLTRMSELDKAIATAIIDSIDEDGYLGATLEDIQKSLSMPELEIDLAEIEAVLHQVQNFDPVGVGARDLCECLSIQLRHCPDDTPWRQAAVTLVSEYLELLGQRDYAQLMRLLKLEKEELQEVIELIKTLAPRPGDVIQSSQPEYVIPDVIVRNVKGTWRVELKPTTALIITV
jgi:RNA polymerase sigma-54 factor